MILDKGLARAVLDAKARIPRVMRKKLQMNSANYSVGIIGLGGIGCRYERGDEYSRSHADAYTKRKDVKLIFGCSPDAEHRDWFAHEYQATAYEDVDQMLSVDVPDVVSVCSPTASHYEHAMACLAAGVSRIWLEKPPATSMHEIQVLLDVANQKNIRVVVNYQRRYEPGYSALQSVIQEKRFGDLHELRFAYSKGLETNASHMLDAMLFLLGDPTNVSVEWVESGQAENPSFLLKVPQLKKPVFFSGMDVGFHNIDLVATFAEARVSLVAGGRRSTIESVVNSDGFPGFFHLEPSSHELFCGSALAGGLDKALSDLLQPPESSTEPLSSLQTACQVQRLLEEIKAFSS